MNSKNKHGGSRPGAGRPKGQGPYGESTQAMRVPLSMVHDIREALDARRQASSGQRKKSGKASTPSDGELQIFRLSRRPGKKLPMYRSQVAAGFPSPADDYLEDTLDLNELLINHPAATFMVRAAGESMLGAGIHPGDIMIVDRAIEVSDGKIIIAVVDGELTVKRFRRLKGRVFLQAENPKFPNIKIDAAQNFSVWGVVVNVIHKV